MPLRVAVLIPCLNEERSVGTVVEDFRRVLPGAVVYVYDNGSADGSAACASAAGAVVQTEARLGKGLVVRRMFFEVDADIYVLVDGDDTYDSASAPELIGLLQQAGMGMAVGTRAVAGEDVWRTGHLAGNRFFSSVISLLFGQRLTDVLSGYRVFSREFVKSFAGSASGFEIEAELTIHALTGGFGLRETATPYRARPAGSRSKLNTWRDGLRILWFILYARIGRTTSPSTSVSRKSRP